MEIYLVRHTAPAVAAGICYGQTDVDTGKSFAHEFAILHSKLEHLESPAIYSSPLKRCAKLADAFAEHSGFSEITHDTRLMELNFGEWEMRPWDEVPRGEIEIWAEEHVSQAPPNGESFHDLHHRANAFLDEVSANNNGVARVVVFTHAGVIRALLAEALSLPLVNAFRLQIDYASVSQIIMEGQIARIGFVNR